MQKEVNDQELTLKKRARRRLVGAIALVLFMVIVLPMVLKDRSNKQPADEVTITLNNSKPAVVPEVSDFDSNIVPSHSESPNVVQSSEEAVESNSQQSESQAVNQSEMTEEDAEASPKAELAKTEIAKVESPKVATKPPVIKSPVIKPTDTAKTDSKKSTSNAKFYVQIGVFSDEANVKKLQSRLTELGYKSQTEKIDTAKGKKIRLRTQLLGERNDAAIALQTIKDGGLTGMVVSQ